MPSDKELKALFDNIDSSTQHEPASIEQPDQVSGLEAGTRGAAQGLSLGFFNKAIEAPISTAADVVRGKTSLSWQDLKSAYESNLAREQAREKLASQQHPLIYHGAEIAAPFVLPVAGALGAAGKLGTVGAGLAEGAQALNLPGKLVGAVGAGIEALPGAEAVAQALPNITRIGKGAIEGAALGGTYAAGKSQNDLLTPETAEDVKHGMEFGGVLGGGLSTLGAIANQAAIKGAGREGLLGNISRSYLSGMEGKNLANFNKVADQAFDYSQITGNKWMQEEVGRIKAAFNAAQEAGDASGAKANIQDIFQSLQNMKNKAENVSDPAAQKTINQLINLFENQTYGLEQAVEKQQMVLTQKQVPGQEAVPSTMEDLQSQVSQLNANAEASAKQTGEPIKKYQVVTDPNSGKLNIKEITPQGADAAESARIVNKEWIEPQQGSPQIEPSIEHGVEYEPVTSMERPGNTPELGMNQAVDLEKGLGEDLQDTSLSPRQKNIIGQTREQVKAKTQEINPDYAQPREEWKQMLAALDKAGINKADAIDFDIGAPGMEEKLNSVAPEVMQNINDQIINSQKPGYEGRVAKENLDRFFNYLQKAGYEDVSEIRQQLEQNMRDYNLSQNMNANQMHPGIASHNPHVAGLGILKSFGVKGAHYAGLAQQAPITQNLASLAPGVASSSFGSAVPKSTPMENFSRDLSYSNTQQLGPVYQALKSDKNLSYLGDALEKAIMTDNQIQKNAIIFAISQNPEARKLLNEGQK